MGRSVLHAAVLDAFRPLHVAVGTDRVPRRSLRHSHAGGIRTLSLVRPGAPWHLWDFVKHDAFSVR